MDYFSIIPPIAAIIGAAVTKRIIPSLVFGLLAGTLLKAGGSTIDGVISAGEYLARVIADEERAYIILFLFGFGALAEIFKVGGGISGFAKVTDRYIKTERGALLSIFLVTPLTFLDCCFHVISTGTISKPILEKVNGSNDKLAFIINTTSSQLIVLIPFATTYLGYILGLIGTSMSQAGITGSPYMIYLLSIPFNFYSISMVIIAFLATFMKLEFKFLRVAVPAYKPGVEEEGDHHSHEAHEECEFAEKVAPKIVNLLLPMLLLIASIFYLFWLTGQKQPGLSIWDAFMSADYEKSIFVATFAIIVITVIFYVLQKIPMGELQSHFLSGGTEMLPPIVILVLAWGIAAVTQDLGFNTFVGVALGKAMIPVQFVPLAIFAIGALASYFMGSSWGTWALVMPVGLSLATATGASIPLTVGAVLAGGSIGDNLSPLGETPVLTAAITKMQVTSHVQYVLPYGLVAIAISVILFIFSGYVIH